MGASCGIKSSSFYLLLNEKVRDNTITSDQKIQILEQYKSPEFETWYGTGKRTVFSDPKIVDKIYIENDKLERILIIDLRNKASFEAAQINKNKINILEQIKEFFTDQNVGLKKRISAHSGTAYAKGIDELLNKINTLHENQVAEALTEHTTYILKTINKFKEELSKYEETIPGDFTEEQLKERDAVYFNFLLQAEQFTDTFDKITKLPTPNTADTKLNEVLTILRDCEPLVSDLKKTLDKEITKRWKEQMSSFSTNPLILNGAMDFLAAQEDESGAQRWLDALADSHHPVLASIGKQYARQLDAARIDTQKGVRVWKKFCEDNNLKTEADFKKFIDDKGRFLDEYDYEGFTEALKEARQPLNELEEQKKKFKEDSKSFTKEYAKALNDYTKWKRANTRQPYTAEYYAVLDLMTLEAREAYSEIRDKKEGILNKDKLSFEDHEALKQLELEMKYLKSSNNPDGSLKTGQDKAIADSIFKYTRASSKFYKNLDIDKKAFKRGRAKAASENRLKEFLDENIKEEFSKEFWDKFNSIIAKFPVNKELSEIKEQIAQLLLPYKDANGLNISDIPENVRKTYNELKVKRYEASKKVKVSHVLATELSNLVKNVPSEHYKKLLASKKQELTDGIITQEEFKAWYDSIHSFDEYTQTEQLDSEYTRMIPKDKNHIQQNPTKEWQSTVLKTEYYNNTGNEPYWEDKKKNDIYTPITNSKGYSLPKNQWINDKFASLSDIEKNQLNFIKETLYDLIKHINQDKVVNLRTVSVNDSWIGQGGIPSFHSHETKKEDKKDSVDKAITETDDIVRFIPFQFMKKLNQEELPVITNEMSEEEKEKTQKLINEIKEKNKLNHKDALNHNLYETIEHFIAAANTNRRKTEMKPYVDASIAKFKHLKITQKNAKGETLYDKTKSTVTGNKEEFEKDAVDSNAYKHLLDWVDGVFYEEFNLDEGALTEWSTRIQNMSSLLGIGFNWASGINNKIVGNIQLKIEAAGGQYFNYKELSRARKNYALSLMNFYAEHGKNESKTLLTGLVRAFDVIQSQDELALKPKGTAATIMYKLRLLKDAAYFMQEMGEHQIQNTSLLAMLHSHRIVDGQIVSYFEYASKFDISTEVKKMEDEGKTRSEILSWININKKDKRATRTEFEKYSALIDEYELSNGIAELKKTSVLTNEQISDFRQKVIGINQKMHGIYNTDDAAMLQRHALGRLGMQFRKWIPSAWNRRFGAKFGKSYWNERRQEYNEGMYVTSFKYIAKPFTKTFEEYRAQQESIAMAAFKTFFMGIKQTFANAKINWHSLTPIEQANVKRTGLEALLVVGVLILGNMLMGDDDDDEEKKNWLTTWGLFQCDRLYGELTTFAPWGVLREGNRLFDNPLVAFKTFDKITKLLWASVKYPFIDEEEATFKSGIFHGRSKVSVYLMNDIPLLNQIQSTMYMTDNNQRYNMFK